MRRQPPSPLLRRALWAAGLLLLIGLLLALYRDDLVALYEPFARLQANPAGGLPLEAPFWNAGLSLAFALAVAAAGRALFFRLVSQFVLPLSTPEERRQAVQHFLRYAAGRPGPLVFVKDGRLIAGAGDKRAAARGAGVAWVNSASAVVLRTETAFTRVRGPGLVFMRGGEYLTDESVLDLRLQARTLEAVPALTRDGIPVSADVTVTFLLDSGEAQPLRDWSDPSRPPFLLRPRSAFAAIYGQAYRGRTRGLWAELPPLLAADVLREALMARDFESLFSSSETGLPLLAGLQYQVERRLMGAPAAGPAREQQLLAERGLRVVRVSVSNLRLPEDVHRIRLANWRADWRSRAGELAAEVDPEIRAARQRGQDDGRLAVLAEFSRALSGALRAGGTPGRKATASGLAEAARRVALDPALQGSAGAAEARHMLEDLELWVKGWREA